MNREDTERAYARKGRTVGLAIAATMVIWLGGTTLVAAMGWQARYVFLFDLAAMAAFVWIFAVLWQMWRLRQELKDSGQR
ncbi:DUF5337 domain-containing protein [Pseudooceanicola pacificus]